MIIWKQTQPITFQIVCDQIAKIAFGCSSLFSQVLWRLFVTLFKGYSPSALPNKFWKVWDDSVFLSQRPPCKVRWWFSILIAWTLGSHSPTSGGVHQFSWVQGQSFVFSSRSPGQFQPRASENFLWKKSSVLHSSFQFKGDTLFLTHQHHPLFV